MVTYAENIHRNSDKTPRKIVRLTWILTLLTLFYYLIILTNGRFDLFRGEIHGKVFNSMLLNLLQGDFTVDPAAIGGEAMIKDDKTYSYFGIFPAVFRGLFLPVFDLQTVWLSRFSVFSALAISLIFQVKTWLRVFAGTEPSTFSRHALFIVLISLLGSSPHLFLASNASVYHEPIIWAAAAASVFNYYLVRSAFDGKFTSTGSLYIMAIAAGVCVHSRVHIAIGLYIALFFLIVMDFLHRRQQWTVNTNANAKIHEVASRVIGPLLVVGMFGLFYLGINYGRWGDPLVSAYHLGHGPTMSTAARIQNYLELGTFHWTRIPVSLEYYVIGSLGLFRQLLNGMNTSYDLIEDPWISGLLSSPIFSILMLLGLFGLLSGARNRMRNNTYVAIGLAGEGVSVVLLLSFMAVTLRYRMDLWAFSSLAAVLGFQYLTGLGDRVNKGIQAAILVVGWLSVLVGVVSSHFTMFEYKLSWFSSRKPPEVIVGFLEWAVQAKADFVSWLF